MTRPATPRTCIRQIHSRPGLAAAQHRAASPAASRPRAIRPSRTLLSTPSRGEPPPTFPPAPHLPRLGQVPRRSLPPAPASPATNTPPSTPTPLGPTLAGSGTLKKEVRYLKPSENKQEWSEEDDPCVYSADHMGIKPDHSTAARTWPPPALLNKRRWPKEEDPW